MFTLSKEHATIKQLQDLLPSLRAKTLDHNIYVYILKRKFRFFCIFFFFRKLHLNAKNVNKEEFKKLIFKEFRKEK